MECLDTAQFSYVFENPKFARTCVNNSDSIQTENFRTFLPIVTASYYVLYYGSEQRTNRLWSRSRTGYGPIYALNFSCSLLRSDDTPPPRAMRMMT